MESTLSRIDDPAVKERMNRRTLPDYWPISAVVADESGRFYLARGPGPGVGGEAPPEPTLEVFDSDGSSVGTVATPWGFQLKAVRAGRVFGFLMDALGQMTIVIAPLPTKS
jgi:hypothetical protein